MCANAVSHTGAHWLCLSANSSFLTLGWVLFPIVHTLDIFEKLQCVHGVPHAPAGGFFSVLRGLHGLSVIRNVVDLLMKRNVERQPVTTFRDNFPSTSKLELQFVFFSQGCSAIVHKSRYAVSNETNIAEHSNFPLRAQPTVAACLF